MKKQIQVTQAAKISKKKSLHFQSINYLQPNQKHKV